MTRKKNTIWKQNCNKRCFVEKTKVVQETIGEHFLLEDTMNGMGYLVAYVPD